MCIRDRNQADLVADKVERTNEAAFEAARRSDEAFETRLKDAEKLTARASQVADDAAESVRRRLEAVLASARAETQTVERHIDTMTERLGEMPLMARERAQEAADALRRGKGEGTSFSPRSGLAVEGIARLHAGGRGR